MRPLLFRRLSCTIPTIAHIPPSPARGALQCPISRRFTPSTCLATDRRPYALADKLGSPWFAFRPNLSTLPHEAKLPHSLHLHATGCGCALLSQEATALQDHQWPDSTGCLPQPELGPKATWSPTYRHVALTPVGSQHTPRACWAAFWRRRLL